MNPVRLQLSRKKGFNLQEHSHQVNGLEAVNVARPTKWGNPFRVDLIDCFSNKDAAAMFNKYLKQYLFHRRSPFSFKYADMQELRGKNLACWCKPGEPCHADVLMELANQ